MFTGTLIEDLIATVESVELRTQAEADFLVEIEPWVLSGQNSASCDHELRGVA